MAYRRPDDNHGAEIVQKGFGKVVRATPLGPLLTGKFLRQAEKSLGRTSAYDELAAHNIKGEALAWGIWCVKNNPKWSSFELVLFRSLTQAPDRETELAQILG